MNLKIFPPFIGVILGILISSEFFQGLFVGIVCIGIALLFWCVLKFFSYDPMKCLRLKRWHFIWIFFLFTGIGSLDFNFKCTPVTPIEIDGEKKVFNGIIEEVKYLADGDRFKIKIESFKSTDKLYQCRNINFLVKTDGFVGSKGDLITFSAMPHKFLNRIGKSTYGERMLHQGVQYYANVKSSNIKITGKCSSLYFKFGRWRDNLIILLENSSLNRGTAEFLISILLGDKTFLDSDVKETLNAAGMAHILALSGMHVAIILSILMWLLFPMSLLGYNRTRQITAIVIIWGYVVLTGGAFSTVRAAIMATFVVGAYVLERKNSALNALLAATMIILIPNPFALWDIGLQLSFLCVASIILFANKLNPIEHHIHPKLYSLVNMIIITVVTSICTWALVSYYFSSVPVLFLAANVILLPLLPFFVAAGILYLILISMGIDWIILASLLDYFNSFFIGSAEVLSGKGGAFISLKVPLMSTVLWICGILIIGFIIKFQNKRYKKYGLSLGSLTLMFSFIFIFLSPEESNSKIKFVHSFTKLEVHHTADNSITKLEFPRKGISSSDLKNIKITAIDNRINRDSIKNLVADDYSKINFLIVGSDADSNQIAELINSNSFSKIILHHSVGKNKKAELLSLVSESEIDKIYSLRENGSLEFDL